MKLIVTFMYQGTIRYNPLTILVYTIVKKTCLFFCWQKGMSTEKCFSLITLAALTTAWLSPKSAFSSSRPSPPHRRQSVASAAAVCRMSRSLCLLSAGCRANIRAASPAGRPNQTLEAGLIGLTYSIKPSIKPPLTTHWGSDCFGHHGVGRGSLF